MSEQQVERVDEETLKRTIGSAYLAVFDIDELVLGNKLGSGGFSDVHEIRAFEPNGKHEDAKKKRKEAREFLIKRAVREDSGEARYAIKFLQSRWWPLESTSFQMAAVDLASEAEILAYLEHPNILKIRGFATNGPRAFFQTNRPDGYFLILDRLYDILSVRIQKWEHQEAALFKKNFARLFVDRRGRKKAQMIAERLRYAFDLASALCYLHKHGFIYRDLKPQNIGFDVRDDIKLFDFGLCREMPFPLNPTKDDEDDLYEMSGNAGTPRYMAPEVAFSYPYNQKADVYSFGLVLYEMLSLKKPFANYGRREHQLRVLMQGDRPPMDMSWPKNMRDMLARSWHQDVTKRATMFEIKDMLRDVIVGYLGDANFGAGDDDLAHEDRRSTYILELPSFTATPSMAVAVADIEGVSPPEALELPVFKQSVSLNQTTLEELAHGTYPGAPGNTLPKHKDEDADKTERAGTKKVTKDNNRTFAAGCAPKGGLLDDDDDDEEDEEDELGDDTVVKSDEAPVNDPTMDESIAEQTLKAKLLRRKEGKVWDAFPIGHEAQ